MHCSQELSHAAFLTKGIEFETERWLQFLPGYQQWAQIVVPGNFMAALYAVISFKDETPDNMYMLLPFAVTQNLNLGILRDSDM